MGVKRRKLDDQIGKTPLGTPIILPNKNITTNSADTDNDWAA